MMKYTTRAKIGKAVTETLEDRNLYSTVSLNEGVLTLATDRPDTIIVDYSGPGKLWAYAGGKQMKVDADEVKFIKVTGSAGNDTVFVNPALKVATHMDLGAGNDTVRGSGGNDTIMAGAGNDVIFARGGQNVVDGGAGRDVIWGGDENDTLFGGTGSDKVYGNRGDNVVSQGGRYTGPVNAPAPTPTTPVVETPTTPATPPAAPVVDETPVQQPQTPADPAPTPVENTNDVNAPVVKVSFLRQSVAAGQAIHAHALETQLKSGTILTAKFEWSFGDGSDSMLGWNAAHKYDTAGTYTMTLKVTDDQGRVTVHNETIRITEAQRTKYFVSANGNDNADGLTEATAFRTVAKAATKVDDNVEILFRRGDRFDVSEDIAIADTNVVIGAYGTGSRPVLNRVEGNGSAIISIWINSVDVTVRDITFDSKWAAVGNRAPKISADGIFTAGKNVTVSGCEFRNLTNAINDERKTTGLLVENNTAPLATGLRAYFIWGQGSDYVITNNVVANSTREHVIRVYQVDRMQISGNDFSNLDRLSVDEDSSKGVIELQTASYCYVTGNTVHDGPIRSGPRGGSTEAADTEAAWIVFEDNKVYNTSFNIMPGSKHLMIRNNLINFDNGDAIGIKKPDEQGRTSTDITIDNNTAVNRGTYGKFLWVGGKVAGGITVTDNLFVSPNLQVANNAASAVYVAMNDLSVFKLISGNVWPDKSSTANWAKGGINYVGTSWGTPGAYVTATRWEDYAVVQNDRFVNVSEADMHSYKIGSTVVGSTLRLAA